jgi:uncharacterized protein
MKQELLNILACPQCQSKLTYDKTKNTLTCNHEGLVFHIEAGIPNLILAASNSIKKDDTT